MRLATIGPIQIPTDGDLATPIVDADPSCVAVDHDLTWQYVFNEASPTKWKWASWIEVGSGRFLVHVAFPTQTAPPNAPASSRNARSSTCEAPFSFTVPRSTLVKRCATGSFVCMTSVYQWQNLICSPSED